MEPPLAAVDEMYLEGLAMKRQQFRRDLPGASDAEIEEMIRAWIRDRPLDSPGRVRDL
ncbi:MAG: hypothetical protein ACKOBT_00695 [Actinomycetota bacterium]